jgi:hypothetical protein
MVRDADPVELRQPLNLRESRRVAHEDKLRTPCVYIKVRPLGDCEKIARRSIDPTRPDPGFQNSISGFDGLGDAGNWSRR